MSEVNKNIVSELIKTPDDKKDSHFQTPKYSYAEDTGQAKIPVYHKVEGVFKTLTMHIIRREKTKIDIWLTDETKEKYAGPHTFKLDNFEIKWKNDLINPIERKIGTTYPDQYATRLTAELGKLKFKWIHETETQKKTPLTFPDFEANPEQPLPIFGYTKDSYTHALTEAFWAYPKGGDKKILYVLVSENPVGGSEFSDPKNTLRLGIFPDGNYNFKEYSSLPDQNSKWMMDGKIMLESVEDLKQYANETYERILYEIIPKHLWIKNETHKKFLSYWILATYFHDVFDAYPILFGWGYKGSGKTRLGILISALGYHGLEPELDTSKSDFFRSKEEFHPTTVIDENEQIQNYTLGQMDNLINASYSRLGGGVRRRAEVTLPNGDKGYVSRTFHLYSPTALLSINPLKSEATMSRCVIIPMVKAKENFPVAERTEYKETRDRLYQLRLRGWTDIRQIYDTLMNEKIDGIDSRESELWLPIFTLMRYMGREDEDREDLIQCAKENYELKKYDEIFTSEKPITIKALAMTLRDARATISSIWSKQNKEVWELKIRDITNNINKLRWHTKITERKVGNELTKLGFTGRGNSSDKASSATIFLRETWLNELIQIQLESTMKDILYKADIEADEKVDSKIQ